MTKFRAILVTVIPFGLRFVPEKSCGFAARGQFSCTSCGIILCEDYLSKRVDDSNANRAPFELNMLAAVAFRAIGCGYSF